MDSRREISELNWALGVYSNIIKFGPESSRIEESEKCLQILEEFEEYEKCYDLFLVLNNQEKGLVDKITKERKK